MSLNPTQEVLREFWFLCQEIADGAHDEGDRTYFKSTNQVDELRDLMHKHRYGPIMAPIYDQEGRDQA